MTRVRREQPARRPRGGASPARWRLTDRVRADGSHLELDGEPFRVRGVTYGRTAVRPDGAHYPNPAQVKQDLVSIADAGFNTVRTYDLPPPHLLEIAGELDLRMLIGITYEDWRHHPRPGRSANRLVLDAGRRAIDEALELCADDPLVIAICVGSRIPVDVARTHGIGTVTHALGRLVDQVHCDAPGVLATYDGVPGDPCLDLPGQDLVCLDVRPDDARALRRVLVATQLGARDRPVILTGLGLPSGASGLERQAEALRRQLDALEEVGSAGATIASWTDDWDAAGRSGSAWGFGLTTVNRHPKPALAVAERWARRQPRDLSRTWPSLSVVVYARDEGRRIAACLQSLARAGYPDLEVIVCDDGSSDDTLAVAGTFPVRILPLDRVGPDRCRNAGILAATGAIVAFVDAGTRCHPEWPFHVALGLAEDRDQPAVAVGGPVLPLSPATLVEHAIAASPGLARSVPTIDGHAEQVASANCAFRTADIRAAGGFNPALTSGGADVDLSRRLLDRGDVLAYSTAAQVRAARVDSVREYLAQQRGYGQAEMLLGGRAAWPGHPHVGVPGGTGPAMSLLPRWLRPVLYLGGPPQHGSSAPARVESTLTWLRALTPAAFLVGLVGLLLAWWSPWTLVATAVAAGMALLTAGLAASQAVPPPDVARRWRFRLLVGALSLLQPLARTWGRLLVDPARVGEDVAPGWLGDRTSFVKGLCQALRGRGCNVRYGSDPSTGDLEVRVGPLLAGGVLTAVTSGEAPHLRVTYRLRWTGSSAVLLLVAALVALGVGRAALVPLVLATMVALVERTALQHHVRASADSARTVELASPTAAPDLRSPLTGAGRVGRHARPDTPDEARWRPGHP